MTDTNNKIRALFLTALMVFSVFAGTVAFSGSVAAVANDATLTTDGGTYWQGQQVVYSDPGITEGDTFEIRNNESGSLATQVTAGQNGSVVIDTSNLDGIYDLEDDTGKIATFEVAVQSFDASWTDDSVDNAGAMETEIRFDSNRGTYNVDVTSADLNGDELEEIFNDTGLSYTVVDDKVVLENVNSGEYTANFSDVEGGDYDFDFEVNDTSASASDNITVRDVGAGETSFAQDGSVEVTQGGVANITIDLSGAATGGSLVVGEESSDGYQASIEFTDENDDGQVSILFNTYAAGNPNSTVDVFDVAGEDTISSPQTSGDLSAILASGEYTIATSTSKDPATTLEEPQGISSIFIEERSTDEMSTWTAPGNVDFNADDEGDVTEEDINSLAEDGVLTEDDTITLGDYVVFQVSATGLEGLIENATDFESALGNGLSVTVEQTNPVQNRDPKTLNYTNSTSAIDVVQGDGTYYIAIDVDNAEFERNDAPASVNDGDEFESSFTVNDQWLLNSESEDDYQSVNSTFAVENAETELDNDPIEVTASDNQSISGTSNLAPGTELTIRTRSTGETQPRFFNSQTVTVQSDGTFSGEFDFSDQSAGDTFSVSVRHGSETPDSAEGEVVEDSTETPTETTDNGTQTTEGTPTDTTPTDTTPTEQTPTEQTPTDKPETETTTTTTPGFTAVLALVALIGAALLATRRKD